MLYFCTAIVFTWGYFTYILMRKWWNCNANLNGDGRDKGINGLFEMFKKSRMIWRIDSNGIVMILLCAMWKYMWYIGEHSLICWITRLPPYIFTNLKKILFEIFWEKINIFWIFFLDYKISDMKCLIQHQCMQVLIWKLESETWQLPDNRHFHSHLLNSRP